MTEQTTTDDRLRHLPADEWLGDLDMRAWRELQANRGGCRCHIYSPCFPCTEPPSESELNVVGFTYEQEGAPNA